MRVEIQFSNTTEDGRTFLTWRPAEANIRLLDLPVPAPTSVRIELRSRSAQDGGALVFSNAQNVAGQDSINLDMPLDGSPVVVWIAGKFQSASRDFGDVFAEAQEIENGQLTGPTLASLPIMVRVRKNAESLILRERNRFLSAMAVLNGQGRGRWTDLRDMHLGEAYEQIHSNYSFLPWHRAYLLNLERELQAIDPEVALPYWKFDEPAPKLIQPSFIGRGRLSLPVDFSATNPLRNWSVDGGSVGVLRGNGVGPTNVIPVRNELQSLRISEGPNANFEDFCHFRPNPAGLENDPHNGAHGWNQGGWISNPATSQRDPLFYLLHANVDRLWAKWQWLPDGTVGTRSDPNSPVSYADDPALLNGQNRNDTMWPWDGLDRDSIPTRPPNAPGGGMLDSPMTTAPGARPRVRDMIDYLGANGGGYLGFAYDDVPFEV